MIDFHCHLDLYQNPSLVARKCYEQNVYVLSVTTTPKAWKGTCNLASGYNRIRTALGFHPEIAHARKGELKLFESILPEAKYIGEIGLDGSPSCKKHWKDQLFVFSEILKMSAKAGGRIMSVHSRLSADEVLDELSKNPDAGLPILHWFSGTQAQLQRAIDIGCWFSVGKPMITSNKGKKIISEIPRNRILPETDGPFVKWHGKIATPLDSWEIIRGMGDVINLSYSDSISLVKRNVISLDKANPNR